MVAAVRRAVKAWLSALPSLRLIVTTREQCHSPEEVLLEVPALTPDAAREMLLDRLHRANTVWTADTVPPVTVDALGQRLDGLPLAIELAAARADVLSPEAIVTRLDGAFARNPALISERHRSFARAIQWSWDLLSEQTQRVIMSCGVFRGPFTMADVDGVVATLSDDVDVVEAMSDASAKHFVVTEYSPAPINAIGFRFYEPVREFIAKRLAACELRGATQQAYTGVLLRPGMSVVCISGHAG